MFLLLLCYLVRLSFLTLVQDVPVSSLSILEAHLCEKGVTYFPVVQ